MLSTKTITKTSMTQKVVIQHNVYLLFINIISTAKIAEGGVTGQWSGRMI